MGASTSGYIRLQELTTATASATQELEEAVDMGDLDVVVAQVRSASAASDGTILTLQHAAVLEEDAFVDLCGNFHLNKAGSWTCVYRNTLRYIRWKLQVTGGTATFLVDLVGRCG